MTSSTLRIAWVFGLSGIGFAAGNLLLARTLSAAEYGSIALLVAMINVAVPIGPAGIDVQINRQSITPDRHLLLRVTASGLVVAAVFLVIGHAYYRIDSVLLSLLVLSTVAGALNWTGAAYFQSRGRFGISLWLSQNQNLVLFASAVLVVLAGVKAAWFPATFLAAGYICSCIVAWHLFNRSSHVRKSKPVSLREGIVIVGTTGADLVMMQLDRLIIPILLSLEHLAVFAVLAATVGAPFRVLQLAATYALLPKIRNAATIRERWQSLRTECVQILLVSSAAALAIWLIAPAVIAIIVGDKFVPDNALVVAVVVAGLAKVLSAVVAAAVTAVSSRITLSYLTAISWISVLIAIASAVFGAKWGITGVVYGVASGWLFRALGAASLLPASLNGARLERQT